MAYLWERIALFCRACSVCQRVNESGGKKVPMVKALRKACLKAKESKCARGWHHLEYFGYTRNVLCKHKW